MSEAAARDPERGGTAWREAVRAAALFAVDPGTGGIAVRAPAGPVRDAWLDRLRSFLPHAAPIRRLPLHASAERVLGGLDLAATLQSGRRVAARGLLAEADGGVVLIAMAERLTRAAAAPITAALDTGEVAVERDGISFRSPARIGVVALDEGEGEDAPPAAALLDRLAFLLDLDGASIRDLPDDLGIDTGMVLAARDGLNSVEADEAVLTSLCGTALALGVDSPRAAWLALRVARAAAALAGRREVAEADAVLAARLVLAPRATVLPAAEPPPEQPPEPPPEQQAEPPPAGDATPTPEDTENPQTAPATRPDRPLDEIVLEAAQAALPANLLARLRAAEAGKSAGGGNSRHADARQPGDARGRPIGIRRGAPRAKARLNVVATLRAAAPWQIVRRRARSDGDRPGPRVLVLPDDFRVTRYRQRIATTTIFLVDASGSAALNRLAEAKGAVELVLAECYVRRDRVALVAFRGRGAEMLLPPTNSLVRVKRALAGLPGGGGTPLAAGLDTALMLAAQIRRSGQTPLLVLLSDGRANVARDGRGGRARADADATAAAGLVRSAGLAAVLVDTSPRPSAEAARLAAALGGLYLPLPYAEAGTVARAIVGSHAARHA